MSEGRKPARRLHRSGAEPRELGPDPLPAYRSSPSIRRFLPAAEALPEPSPALRERVLWGVRSQLRREQRASRWRSAAALAATLLLGLGLSLAAGHAAARALGRHDSPPPLHEIARRIQQLSPDLSPEESVRQAMLVSIAAEVGGQPNLGESYEGVLRSSQGSGAGVQAPGGYPGVGVQGSEGGT
jgi:hypothetical protein